MKAPQIDPNVRVTLTLSPREAILVANALSLASAISAGDERSAMSIGNLVVGQIDAMGPADTNALVRKAAIAATEAAPGVPVIHSGDPEGEARFASELTQAAQGNQGEEVV